MAYTPLDLGYTAQYGRPYTATTDSPTDWGSVPVQTTFYDKSRNLIYYKDVNGYIFGEKQASLPEYSIASTQWSGTIGTPSPLPNGDTANGFTFFDNTTEKVSAGSTSYYEFDISYGISITLSGTSGTARISVNGTPYTATFNTNLQSTAEDWVTANQSTLNGIGLQVFALTDGATDGRIRFGATSDTILNGITISNDTGDLNGTIANEFTGSSSASYDHVVIPYLNTPLANTRILHAIRVNFNIVNGSTQFVELGLYRWQNDSLIGSAITIIRNNDVTGQQAVLETYTASATDSFVTGGFYVAVINNSGTTIEFTGARGVLIQSVFECPKSFTE